MTVVLRADDVPAAARCEYVHEVRGAGLSDHSALVADVTF